MILVTFQKKLFTGDVNKILRYNHLYFDSYIP